MQIENVFGSIVFWAMIAGVLGGILSLVFAALAIPYQLLIKRNKGAKWYGTVAVVPFCCFGFAIAIFFVGAFSPNFFGKPSGVTIKYEKYRTVNGKTVYSDTTERNISFGKTATGEEGSPP